MFLLSCHSIENNKNSEHETLSETISLTNTKWEQIVAPNCITTLNFVSDSIYFEDNCEWGLKFEGSYKKIDDSIFLFEYGTESELLENADTIIPKHLLTYLYKGDSLVFIKNQKIENGIIVSTYIPQIPICLKKVN